MNVDGIYLSAHAFELLPRGDIAHRREIAAGIHPDPVDPNAFILQVLGEYVRLVGHAAKGRRERGYECDSGHLSDSLRWWDVPRTGHARV